MRITPEIITHPSQDENVLIGTNEAGIHGAGIARAAMNWGARMGQGFGPMSNCFGLPTKDWQIQTLPLEEIERYVKRYLAWTKLQRNFKWKYMITPIGCGLAGYEPVDIAPMFEECLNNRKFWLPKSFIEVITNKIITV